MFIHIQPNICYNVDISNNFKHLLFCLFPAFEFHTEYVLLLLQIKKVTIFFKKRGMSIYAQTIRKNFIKTKDAVQTIKFNCLGVGASKVQLTDNLKKKSTYISTVSYHLTCYQQENNDKKTRGISKALYGTRKITLKMSQTPLLNSTYGRRNLFFLVMRG